MQISAASIARWSRFETAFDAAATEQKNGVRCKLMDAAIQILEDDDLQFYSNDASKSDKKVTAQICSNNVIESDARLVALEEAYQTTRTDDSADRIDRLARSFKGLTKFDFSRNLTDGQMDAVSGGRDAEAQIAQSNARIQALVKAAQTVAANDLAASYNGLAKSAAGIQPFDLPRMSAIEEDMMDQGQKAIDRVRESDARLADMLSSLALARGNADASIRQSLIDAVAVVVPFDEGRAAPEQQAAIKEGRALAASFAMNHLIQWAGVFDADGSDPEPFERLKSLKKLVADNGGVAAPTAAQQAALRQADIAIGRLDESNRRLRALRDAADAWARNPGPALEATIYAANQAVNDLDRKRMNADQREDYKTVTSAANIIGVSGKLTPETKPDVMIFITARPESNYEDVLIRGFRDELSAGGYKVVTAREEAALIVELDATAVDLSSVTIGSRRVDGATADIALIATWVFDGATFVRARGSGRAANRSRDAAIEAAIVAASGSVFERFDTKVESGSQ